MGTFDEMVTRTQERIAHLHTERVKLESEWRRIPRLTAWAVLAIPAGFIWGFAGVVIVLVATIGLVSTGAYIIGVRLRGTRAEIRDLGRELRIFEAEAGR